MTKNEKANRWVLAVCGSIATVLGVAVLAWGDPDKASGATLIAALISAALVFSLGPD